MTRTVGTTARGIRTPIVKEGDDLVKIVVDSLLESSREADFPIEDGDIVGITESLLARSQGNYVGYDVITEDIKSKFTGDSIGVVYPILSRNRFSTILRGIRDTGKKIYLLLSYPSDEVGNQLMNIDHMYKSDINPYKDLLTEEKYRQVFGQEVLHPFTGIDYVRVYKEIGGDNIEIILSNNPMDILKYTKDVLVANVHDRKRTKDLLVNAGANLIYGLEDLVNHPIGGAGYNPEYGLLGSNLASDHELKLFPRDSLAFVETLQEALFEATGKKVEAMIYGDGAFKDPVGKIWELADPVVSPGYTKGLEGTPNEIKLKYIVDTELEDYSKEETEEIIKNRIKEKDEKNTKESNALGTTPRRITDLLGSLCDLVSGSGDKGTPVVYIKGYFDNFSKD